MTQKQSDTHASNPTCGNYPMPEFGPLQDAILEELQSACQVRRYEQGQAVVRASEQTQTICIVRSGILRMQKTLPDGRQHMVGLMVRGDILGHMFDQRLCYDIEAAVPADLVTFSRHTFEDILARSPELDRILQKSLQTELDRTRDWLAVLACPTVRGRIVRFLLVICANFSQIEDLFSTRGGQIKIRIPISRLDLAHLLGTRPESISRGLHALVDDGIIDLPQPNMVHVLDFGLLVEEAEEPELSAAAARILQNGHTQPRIS